MIKRKGAEKKRSGRKRGGQRKVVPVEELKAEYDLTVKVEVTEYRLHALTCPACGTATRAPSTRGTRAKLPAGVPQGGFGPRFQSMVSILSGRYHLSKRETVGIDVSNFTP